VLSSLASPDIRIYYATETFRVAEYTNYNFRFEVPTKFRGKNASHFKLTRKLGLGMVNNLEILN
jgi:hypothetical protein